MSRDLLIVNIIGLVYILVIAKFFRSRRKPRAVTVVITIGASAYCLAGMVVPDPIRLPYLYGALAVAIVAAVAVVADRLWLPKA